MTVAISPMRITLAGGGTDLPVYYKQFGGLVISASIDKYVMVDSGASYNLDDQMVKYALAAGLDDLSSISVTSDLKGGAGLGGSASLLTAMIKVQNPDMTPREVAQAAYVIERCTLRHATGLQDAYIAAYGGIIAMRITKQGEVTVFRVNLSNEVKKSLVLFDTGQCRRASDVLTKRISAISSCKESFDAMRKIHEIAHEAIADIRKTGGAKLGRLMHEHWEAKKAVLKDHSSEKVDKWYDIAMKCGADGGKISGAGGGGHMLFVCEKARQKQLIEELTSAEMIHVPFQISDTGTSVIN